MAPIQYLYQFRIAQAKRLLADTDRPVGEIARLVGMPDQRHFARLFRRRTGRTPRAFRRWKPKDENGLPGGGTGPGNRPVSETDAFLQLKQ